MSRTENSRRPLLEALGFVQGSARLVALRFFLIVLSGLPALLAAMAGLASGPAREPYFTEYAGRLSFLTWTALLRTVFPAFAAMAVAGVLLAVLADQLLTAGALVMLAPEHERKPEHETGGSWGASKGSAARGVIESARGEVPTSRPPEETAPLRRRFWPQRTGDRERIHVMRTIRREGAGHFWPF